MIRYPGNWRSAGKAVYIQAVENRLIHVLCTIGCKNLALSGGLDSSLLCYYLCQLYGKLEVYTMGESDKHPDVAYAKELVDYFRANSNVKIEHHIYFPQEGEERRPVYEVFYNFVGRYTDEIVAGDGIDEFMGGYYDHMRNPNEETYYKYLRRLQGDHLIPLDQDSGNVAVYLPYLDEKLISLFSQIPLKEKVEDGYRKKFLVAMALRKVPERIIARRKYGFCDVFKIKGEDYENETRI